MTEHSPPIVIGNEPVHHALSRQHTEVVERMVNRLRNEVPAYQRLPEEVLRVDVTRISDFAVRAYAQWFSEGRAPTTVELDRIGQSAALRAEEGFPLEALVLAYVMGFEGIFTTLSANARPEDLQGVLALTRRILQYIKDTTTAVVTGYREELHLKSGQEHDARSALLSALLHNAPSGEAARAAGISLPANYLTVAIAIGRHPDEHETGVDTTVVTRRMLRRLNSVLNAVAENEVLTSLDSDGGVVLLPAPPDKDWAEWTQLITTAQEQTGATITAAAALTAPGEVASAAALTADVLDVLRWFARPPGLYRLDDVLVEYQLTRPGPARTQLAALLDPLAPHPDLLATLSHYLEHFLSRRHTASALHIHPNTIDYRLRKINELAGLDTTNTTGRQRATAALAARRAELSTAGTYD